MTVGVEEKKGGKQNKWFSIIYNSRSCQNNKFQKIKKQKKYNDFLKYFLKILIDCL